MKYEVVVGNIGTVHSGDSQSGAEAAYNVYVAMSEAKMGRASGEPVVLMEDGEPVREHYAPEPGEE